MCVDKLGANTESSIVKTGLARVQKSKGGPITVDKSMPDAGDSCPSALACVARSPMRYFVVSHGKSHAMGGTLINTALPASFHERVTQRN